jgi:hypothetical protein
VSGPQLLAPLQQNNSNYIPIQHNARQYNNNQFRQPNGPQVNPQQQHPGNNHSNRFSSQGNRNYNSGGGYTSGRNSGSNTGHPTTAYNTVPAHNSNNNPGLYNVNNRQAANYNNGGNSNPAGQFNGPTNYGDGRGYGNGIQSFGNNNSNGFGSGNGRLNNSNDFFHNNSGNGPEMGIQGAGNVVLTWRGGAGNNDSGYTVQSHTGTISRTQGEVMAASGREISATDTGQARHTRGGHARNHGGRATQAEQQARERQPGADHGRRTATDEIKTIKIYYTNSRSLVSKIDELRATATDKQPDIILICETWTNPEISNAELTIDGYCIETDLRKDCEDAQHGIGGGLIIFTESGLKIRKNEKYNNNNFNQFASFIVLSKKTGRNNTDLQATKFRYRKYGSTLQFDRKCVKRSHFHRRL